MPIWRPPSRPGTRELPARKTAGLSGPKWAWTIAGTFWKHWPPRWRQLLRDRGGELDRVISYTNSKGTAYDTMLADILHHVIIHGQHHRAQIARLLRRAGYEPPATDFIYYVRDTDD